MLEHLLEQESQTAVRHVFADGDCVSVVRRVPVQAADVLVAVRRAVARPDRYVKV